MPTLTIKKYSNRRLYDTNESRYITLDELTERIKRGSDVVVVDAKSGEDITQATLVQVVLETKAARLLPVPLLTRLIRMQDDALGDFFSRYVSMSLEAYLAAKSGAQALAPYVPFSTLPFSAGNALARAMGALPFWGDGGMPFGAPPPYPQQYSAPPSSPQTPPQASPTPAPEPPAASSEVAALRSELEELKRELRASAKRSKK